jgi:hypothetical protein
VPCCFLPALAEDRSYGKNSGREGIRYFTGWHRVARCSSFSFKSLLQDETEDAAAVSLREKHCWMAADSADMLKWTRWGRYARVAARATGGRTCVLRMFRVSYS